MSKTASASAVPLPANGSSHSGSSMKEISQEVIEEKESIIEQIYRQLKASMSTTNVLTEEVENLKACTQ